MLRAEAEALLHEFTKNVNLRKHALCVEAVMRFYAKKFGENEEQWGIVGLLHDFDYEIHPTIAEHPQNGSAILRERGVAEEVIHAILAHAPHTGEPWDTQLKKTIFAADELAGFVVAVALVRPNKKLSEVTVESVLKKLKSSAFAANVSREEITQGVKELGIPLESHVQNTIQALQGISDTLGL
ncbi:MAG: HDIG domain-containing metalloprotein [Patescibacteria group bacterium]|jgi:putative nucleotidyltransferase with HDIG domain